MLKRRFPYLVHMRVNFKNAVKVIMCCVVLHNMTITWRDEMSKDINDPDEQQQPQVHVNEYYDRAYYNNLGRVQRRRMGQQARDNVCAQMDPVASFR